MLDALARGYHLDEIRYGPEEMQIALMLPLKVVDELAPKHGYKKVLVTDIDRKTAICLAALALIRGGKG